jgi:Tfp pilus assembly protein PilX
MKQAMVVLVVMTLWATTSSQDKKSTADGPEHAPTVAQCRADAALWYADMAINQHSFIELSARMKEMAQCSIVDTDEATYGKYVSVLHGCQNEEFGRMVDFMTRNQLWDKFLSEDASGKR